MRREGVLYQCFCTLTSRSTDVFTLLTPRAKNMRKEPNFNFSEGATFSDFQLSWDGLRVARERPSRRATLWDFLLAHWPPVRCVLCTRTLRNVLGILFSTQAVWPHAKWRQHSSCYRSASVRVVMVAAPKSRYLPSEREKNCHSPRSEAHSQQPDAPWSEWSWPTGIAPWRPFV